MTYADGLTIILSLITLVGALIVSSRVFALALGAYCAFCAVGWIARVSGDGWSLTEADVLTAALYVFGLWLGVLALSGSKEK